MKKDLANNSFLKIDNIFRKTDRKDIRRTKNIRLIPGVSHRIGGKKSYAEWAHVVGIFQTVLYQTLKQKTSNNILDIGCGTGLLGIASEQFTFNGGMYTGLDVMESNVKFCQNHYKMPNYNFIHFNVANSSYAKSQNNELTKWPIEDGTKDLVTALSVWTHLNERDAKFYFTEIFRVLKKGGKAIVTFFYLDEKYQESLLKRKDKVGRYHSTNQNSWIFNTPAYSSKHWFSPDWVKNPEEAIGITPKGLSMMLENLKLIDYYPGNWKEYPGIYFQDVLIFEK